jgi:branched-chain amino acid transport system substrate-binding protein
MNRLGKRLGIGVLVLGIVFNISAGGKQEAAKTDETVYIALTAPITGDYAEYGNNFKRSVEMAIDQINAKGGVLGRKLAVLVGDSKGDPKESATLAQKWTSDPRIVAQIGDFTSTCCLAAQPIYDQAGMVQLSPTSSHTKFAPGSKWSFSIVGTQAGEQPFVADYAYNLLGFRKIAVIHINNDWGVDTAKYFTESFKKLGGTITAVEKYFDGEKDFTAILTKLRASNPDALFMAAMYNDGAAISNQRAKLGWNLPVVGPSSLYSEQLLKLGGDSVNNLYTVVSFFTDDPRPEIQAYVTEFQKRYGVKPNFHAALAYDSMMLLADAMKRAGSFDRNKVREALQATKNFPGLAGSITFTESGDAIKEYTRVWIVNNKFELYKK